MPPRFVSVKVIHGRSVPVSLQGVMHRLRVGDDPISIPYAVYLRYAHKLALVGESAAEVAGAMEAAAAMQVADTAIKEADVAGVETAAPTLAALPTWPMRVGPEEYISLYEDRPNKSKTMIARLELARQIVAAKEAHG